MKSRNVSSPQICQKWGFKRAPKLYHAVVNDNKYSWKTVFGVFGLVTKNYDPF